MPAGQLASDIEIWYNRGSMLYFAYGSNTNLSVLHKYLVQHGCDPRGIRNPRRVFLDDFQIRTNYLMGGMTGATNIEPAKGKRVEGMLMEITPQSIFFSAEKKDFRTDIERPASLSVFLVDEASS